MGVPRIEMIWTERADCRIWTSGLAGHPLRESTARRSDVQVSTQLFDGNPCAAAESFLQAAQQHPPRRRKVALKRGNDPT